MFWYVLVAFSCFAGIGHRAVGQSDELLQFSNDWDVGNLLVGTSSNDGATEMDVFRLPTNIFPVSYGLEVETDFVNLTYSGKVEIIVNAVAQTCQIVLNAKDVEVTGVEVIDQNSNETLRVVNHFLINRNEQYIITLNETHRCLMHSRLYIVKVTFRATLRDDMSGYYKSSYQENNITKWLAVTQFEPTYARRAFPCFDEPALKTPFKVSLRRRSDQISLSNMPLMMSVKIPETNMYWDHFQESPPMSSYLVFFFVGEFYAIKTPTVGVYTHKNYINQTKYIVNKAPKLIEAMTNYTGVDYMLPKIDFLAIPDFSFGAMENWGLNTYRERLLLLAENSKTTIKNYITTMVQHELSHQWFGDLVTCAWWDYLWLNEGFATYFEYFATKMVEPNWRLEDVFIYEVHQNALDIDQHPTTHPITGSVKTPIQINEMFDDISYDKAGAVLRMLQYTVTEDNFKKALNFYLNTNKYQAVDPENLWNAFENVLLDANFELEENINITQYMKSWTEQAGYPLVNIVKKNNTFIVTQERFFVDPSNEIGKTKWIIGLTYTTEDKKDFNAVLPKIWMKENEMVLLNQSDPGWYIFNLQSIGFYRVNYDEDNWNAIINQLYKDNTIIHVRNRAQLIDDAFNLAMANKVDYFLVLKLTKYLKNEEDVVPWFSAKYGFSYLLNRMRRNPEYYKHLKIYVGYLAGLIYNKTENLVVNRNVTDHSILIGWDAFSNWACSLDNEICMNSTLLYFDLWRQGKKIPADIKDATLCTGVKNGDSTTWNTVLQFYVNSNSASDRQSAQRALACSKDELQLTKYLDFMMDGYNSPIRPQDFKVIYQSMAASPQGISALTQFLTTKLDRITKEVINGERVATSIYSILASSVALDEEILKIDNLRKNSSVPEYLRRKFNFSYSTVDDNLDWFNTFDYEVGEWSIMTVRELGLDSDQPITSSTPLLTSSATSPVTSSDTSLATSPVTSPVVMPTVQTTPSSSTSSNSKKFRLILLLVLSTLIVNLF